VLLFVSSALAATVAVLPLDQGAGGTPYEGLGKALAGMLTTDLSTAPGVSLVERARLDALLSEVDLAKGGFLDPATAQKLGKGLGAEYVVMGSYSVVEGQFLLDARLVGVESAKVVRAADAHGPVTTFVDVEKTLVTGLLDGLQVTLAEDVRTRLLASAPTRDFQAFAAYGEGIAKQDAGDIAGAQAAFGVALQEDPAFTAAKDALGGLRLLLDKMAADKARARQQGRYDALEKVIAAHPVPKDLKDTKARPGFVLRLAALEEEGRYCQRYQEMRAYADTIGWKLAIDEKAYKRLHDDAAKEGVASGYMPAEKADPQGYSSGEHELYSQVGLFGSPVDWLYQLHSVLLDVPGDSGMLASMAHCLSAPEQLTALGEIQASIAAAGLAQTTIPSFGAVPVSELIEWSALSVQVRMGGVDAARGARITELVKRDDQAANLGRGVLALGEAWERGRARRLGFTVPELTTFLAGLAAKDPARVALDAPNCAAGMPLVTAQSARFLEQDPPPDPMGFALVVAPYRDLGCAVGTPARFATPADAFTYVATAPTRVRPEHAQDAACLSALRGLPKKIDPVDWQGKPAAKDAPAAASLLQWYYQELVLPLCVTWEG
jgi:TolB-like protein